MVPLISWYIQDGGIFMRKGILIRAHVEDTNNWRLHWTSDPFSSMKHFCMMIYPLVMSKYLLKKLPFVMGKFNINC